MSDADVNNPCDFDGIAHNVQTKHRKNLGQSRLVSVVDTLTAGFKKPEHPLRALGRILMNFNLR